MKIFTSFDQEMIDILNNGGVGVIPTDTVYGVVTRLDNSEGVARMYSLKDRDEHKPVGTILIADSMQIDALVPSHHRLAAEVYWPGAVSVILPVPGELQYAHKGWNSLPFRVPDHPTLQAVLTKTGPLATSSANAQGRSPATTIDEALSHFRDGVDFYVDGGDLSSRSPSRIISILPDGTIEEIRS